MKSSFIQKHPHLSYTLFGIVFSVGFVSCAYFTASGFKELWWGIQSSNWPAAVASIDRMEMIDGRHTAHIAVKFRYEVDGKSYLGNKIAFDQISGTNNEYGFSRAMHILKEHPPGKSALAYYDPSTPETAVLQRGFSWRLFVDCLFYATLCAVGGLSFFWNIQEWKNRFSPRRYWWAT
ncbi:MAG TPA: DUF3592 domain-containing protein [Candidatus Methylacidiphilales bacterium]